MANKCKIKYVNSIKIKTMKKNLISLLLLLVFTNAFSQNFIKTYTGRISNNIKKEKLNEIHLMSELIDPASLVPNYHLPQEWNKVIDLVTVKITTAKNGMDISLESHSDVLSPEQKSSLNDADLGSFVLLEVTYYEKDQVSASKGPNVISTEVKLISRNFVFKIVPEIEAEFPGGMGKLGNYLFQNYTKRIEASGPSIKDPKPAVSFIINEAGEMLDLKLFKSCSDTMIDQFLLDAFKSMPKWQAAQNTKGEKVKQFFVLFYPFIDGC